jgi:hypothetical protein
LRQRAQTAGAIAKRAKRARGGIGGRLERLELLASDKQHGQQRPKGGQRRAPKSLRRDA